MFKRLLKAYVELDPEAWGIAACWFLGLFATAYGSWLLLGYLPHWASYPVDGTPPLQIVLTIVFGLAELWAVVRAHAWAVKWYTRTYGVHPLRRRYPGRWPD